MLYYSLAQLRIDAFAQLSQEVSPKNVYICVDNKSKNKKATPPRSV